MLQTRVSVTIGLLLIIAGLTALAFRLHVWPWGTIGGQLALGAVVLMLFRDRVHEYGEESFEGQPDAEQLANSALRPVARKVHPFIYAFGIPLVLVGALFQVVGNPSDALILRAEKIPDRVVFLPKASGKLRIDLAKLDQALAALAKNQEDASAALANMYHLELIVVNCGAAGQCACPEGYSRVKDTGKWNLNAGTSGDSIALCSANRRYEMPPK